MERVKVVIRGNGCGTVGEMEVVGKRDGFKEESGTVGDGEGDRVRSVSEGKGGVFVELGEGSEMS